MEECIFCKIVRGEIPCTKVYENDDVLAFADINPIMDGHTLIIPKVHAENIWEIGGESLTAIHLASMKVAAGMKRALEPEGIAFVQLNGKGVNQVVMHYHLHLVPRPKGAPELPLTGWEMVPGDMEKIKKIADEIAGAIQ